MMLLYAYDAHSSGATSIHIYPPAIRRYPMLGEDTCFVTVSGQQRRSILLRTIYLALHQQVRLPYLDSMPSAVVTSLAKKN